MIDEAKTAAHLDITAPKQVEEALKRAQDELERRVLERTRELQQVVAQLEEEAAARRRAQEALAHERQRFYDVLEMLPAYLVLLTPDYHVPFANRYFEEQFGKSQGKRCFEYLFGRTEPCETCETYTVLKTQAPHRWEWTGPNGRIYDIYDFPFTDADGSPLIMEMGMDITERKQGEEEIKKLNEELEIRVHQRTAELEVSNRKLNRTLGELARSNKELEEFAYVASHDLQEPLRKIANFSEMLAKKYQGRMDEQADRYFGYISDGAKRMKALINDLLSYSRVTRVDFPLIPAKLEDILQGTINDIQPLILEKQARISFEPLPTLNVNPPQISRLFQNLITNAIKFCADCAPQVRISARQEGREWVISVKDNGIGFEPQQAERIFKVFQRLHSKEQYPGTGIGLAVCQKIVERHGGRIWAESEPGQGAAFHFTIPA